MKTPGPTHDGSLPDLCGIHVAVIDDDQDTRDVLSIVLRHCGAAVTAYDSAKAALADIVHFLPSIFICDLAMPGMDGFEFIRHVRGLADDKARNIPALAITGLHREFAVPLAKAAGFNAYLVKPMEIDVLCQVVKDILPPPPYAQRFA